MMAAAKVVVQVVALLLLVTVASHRKGAEAAGEVSCGDAVNALIPCGAYLIGAEGPMPTDGCCRSAQRLNGLAPTTEARRSLCQCFKQTGPSFGVKPERAKSLPGFCNLKLGILVSPNVDCNKM